MIIQAIHNSNSMFFISGVIKRKILQRLYAFPNKL